VRQVKRLGRLVGEYDLILLSIAVGFAVYLNWRCWPRAGKDSPGKHRPGHCIDVTGISDRIHRLRSDYVAELQSRPHCVCRRAALLTLFRRAVGRLSYLRSRAAQKTAATEQETTNPAA